MLNAAAIRLIWNLFALLRLHVGCFSLFAGALCSVRERSANAYHGKSTTTGGGDMELPLSLNQYKAIVLNMGHCFEVDTF